MSLQVADNPVNAASELCDIARFNCRKHRDAKLIATEFAIGLSIDDAVCTQYFGNDGGIGRAADGS